MSEDSVGEVEHDYSNWKARIRSELTPFEGHGPPTVDELWSAAKYEAGSAADWIGDMPADEDSVQAAKGDVLTALVALEMAEEKLQEGDDGE